MAIEKIFEHARSKPQKVAMYYRGYGITYREFAFWIASARRFLSHQDLRLGSVAVLLGVPCRLDAWAFDFALRSLGLNVLSVRSEEEFQPLQVRNIGCVITTIQDSPIRVPEGNTNYKLIRVPHPLYLGKAAEEVPELPAVTTPAGGHIQLTSGTTGARKKVLFDAGVLLGITERHSDAYFISEHTVANVIDFAMWGGAGYKVPLCTWHKGGAVIFYQGDDPYRSFLVDGITHAFCTPEKLSKVLATPTAEIHRTPNLKLFVAGAPLTPTLASAAKAQLDPQLFALIASTEVGPWALTRIERPEDLSSHVVHPFAEVQVVDQADQPLPAGQMGNIRVRTAEGIMSYIDDDIASREFFRDGYFYPGDLGEFRGDGRLVLYGRASNVINLGGIKLAAEPVERMLQARLGAEATCLLMMRGEGGDEEFYVVIQQHQAIGQAEVAAKVSAALPDFPPIRIHFCEAIPRNEMGKIDRIRLRQQISATRAGAVHGY